MQLLARLRGSLPAAQIDSGTVYLVRDAYGSVGAGRVMETGRLWERRATDIGLVTPHLSDQRRPQQTAEQVTGYLALILMRHRPTEEDLQALRDAPAVSPGGNPAQAQREVDAWGDVISGRATPPKPLGGGWSIQTYDLRIVTTVVDPRRVRPWRG